VARASRGSPLRQHRHFNRSHYEDVIVVRVKSLVPESQWRPRYDRINDFERLLAEGNTTIVKCFLHISKDAQRKRLQQRIDDPEKRWKYNKQDLAERALWDDYQEAYEEALTRCNTAVAPWHIIPSDRKWYRNYAVSQVVRKALEQMNPHYPPAEDDLEGVIVQ
jgi:polyphosphate kinase 2 (PPK2 family)